MAGRGWLDHAYIYAVHAGNYFYTNYIYSI